MNAFELSSHATSSAARGSVRAQRTSTATAAMLNAQERKVAVKKNSRVTPCAAARTSIHRGWVYACTRSSGLNVSPYP